MASRSSPGSPTTAATSSACLAGNTERRRERQQYGGSFRYLSLLGAPLAAPGEPLVKPVDEQFRSPPWSEH